MISPELQSKIAEWRRRAVTNELTEEEMREAVALLREGRLASAQSAAVRKKAIKAIPHADDLLGELEGL
jgi:hypothetical protein